MPQITKGAAPRRHRKYSNLPGGKKVKQQQEIKKQLTSPSIKEKDTCIKRQTVRFQSEDSPLHQVH